MINLNEKILPLEVFVHFIFEIGMVGGSRENFNIFQTQILSNLQSHNEFLFLAAGCKEIVLNCCVQVRDNIILRDQSHSFFGQFFGNYPSGI